MNNLIPQSKAKTAYGLLSEVSRLILAEPKRYDQSSWLRKIEDVRRLGIDVSEFPACGTIGCVAGWVSTIKPLIQVRSIGGDLYGSPSRRAQRILGLDEDQASELFSGSAVFDLVKPGKNHPREGTRAYARLGVRHIQGFQRKHKTQLLATKV